MSHITKFLSRKGCRGSTTSSSSRSLASAANPADEPPKGVYVENDDPLHKAKWFPSPLQQQTSEKEIEAGVIYFTAKSHFYNKILNGDFRVQVTDEDVNTFTSGIMPDMIITRALTLEEKKSAAEKGAREALGMFNFFPDK